MRVDGHEQETVAYDRGRKPVMFYVAPVLKSRPFVLGVVFVGLAIAAAYSVNEGAKSGAFASCRNHSSFVSLALNGWFQKNQSFPFERGLPGEELFCRIDFGRRGQNCNAAAPGQSHGGWQMVNAPKEVWEDILERLPREIVPVIWCGRAHTVDAPPLRIVITLDHEWKDEVVTLDSLREYYYWTQSAIRTMEEPEFRERLEAIDEILAEHGLPPTVVDVEGREDYWAIAKPYQTEPR